MNRFAQTMRPGRTSQEGNNGGDVGEAGVARERSPTVTCGRVLDGQTLLLLQSQEDSLTYAVISIKSRCIHQSRGDRWVIEGDGELGVPSWSGVFSSWNTIHGMNRRNQIGLDSVHD